MAQMMKAAVLKGPMDIETREVPRFAPANDQVTVCVEACGVCGSDIRYFKGENPWSLHTLGVNLPNPPNIILGHEFAGEVVEVGDSSHELLLGKRVAVLPYKECGVCEHCRSGAHNLCRNMIHIGHGAGWGEMDYYPGGMAEYCPVWARMCYDIPEEISYEDAALIDVVGVALHAVRVSGMRPGADAAVIGCGPIGNSISQILRSWGARRVFCIDRYATSLDIIRKLGMRAVDASVDASHCVKDETNGKGVELVFDTVGSEQTQRQGLDMLAPQGTMVNMVSNATEFSFKLMELGSERAMKSSSNYLIPEFKMAIDLVGWGKVDVSPMITHRFPLSDVKHAFDLLVDKEAHGVFKVIVRPQVGPGRGN